MRMERIELRVLPEEKQGFEEAASIAGISLSAWIRERLRLAAVRELEAASRSIPFLKSES